MGTGIEKLKMQKVLYKYGLEDLIRRTVEQ
jgi:hypothetical protein